MTGLALSLPTKRVSAWIAETEPRYAQAWLASLPLADSAETAREIYQALYTLNRQELDVTRRFELMELYTAPVASVTSTLESYFTRAALPLTPKKRQLAEFIRQLHMEMAYGYKGCLQDLEKQRMRWGKKSLRAQTLVRALHYLGEVLLHSYQVYMPYPPEVWREIHAIYQYASRHDLAQEVLDTPAPVAAKTTLSHEYLRILLLGLSNPYQLPQNECRQVHRFLHQWGGKAVLKDNLEVLPSAGYFLIDPATDSPPVPFPRGVAFQSGQGLRLLDAVELLRSIQFFIQRLQKGDSARTLSLGFECLDSVCLDMLQRMMRSWGQLPRRQYSRIQRSGPAFVCAGIPALHFFASGQKPFVSPAVPARKDTSDDRIILPSHIEEDVARETKADEDFIALDELVAGPMPQVEPRDITVSSGEGFRVDRWQIKDAAPKGLQLVRFGSSHTYVRVGDVVGVQQMDEIGRWSAGVVRWMKSPEADSLEMGIELLASGVKPVAVTVVRGTGASDYQPALLLPAIEALRRPATLLLPRGVYAPGSNLLLAEEAEAIRTVRLLQRLEYTNVFELLVFADVIPEQER
ncbi:MAG: cyclic-di-GMP receptor FimW [Sulfuricaulis sp.]